ncbi:MAG: hypothetical protein HKO53_07870 [Gemmatimonadetes bacterium]|nr:hypothetical protein [Gemmatimonadota bacterium]
MAQAPTCVRLGLHPLLDDAPPPDAVLRIEEAGGRTLEHPLDEIVEASEDLWSVDVHNPRAGVPYTISVVCNDEVRVLLRDVVLQDLVADLQGVPCDPPAIEQDGLWCDDDGEDDDG